MHSGVTRVATMTGGVLTCTEEARVTVANSVPIKFAVATKPLGKQSCQVAAGGSSFACTPIY